MKHTYRPGTIRIVAGSLNWKNYDEQNAQVISVDRVMVHDGWTQKIGQNDIALLHLATPIQYVQKDRVIVNKVCLSREADSEHSGMATSSGWGFLNKDTRVTPEMLRRVDIPVVDHATCRNAFSRVIGISQLQVCAGQAPRGNCMVSVQVIANLDYRLLLVQGRFRRPTGSETRQSGHPNRYCFVFDSLCRTRLSRCLHSSRKVHQLDLEHHGNNILRKIFANVLLIFRNKNIIKIQSFGTLIFAKRKDFLLNAIFGDHLNQSGITNVDVTLRGRDE